MDNNVPRIQPRDPELARIQNNLANTLQGVLDSASASRPPLQLELSPVMRQPRGPGTPYQLAKLALKIHGDTSQIFTSRNYTVEIGDAATTTTPQCDVQLGFWGRIVLSGQKLAPDPFVIIPGVAGTALRVTNTANTATTFSLDDAGNLVSTGTVTAASVLSASGFKSWLPPLSYWNPNYGGGSQALVQPIVQTANGTASTTPYTFVCVRAGSITGLSAAHTGNATLTCALQLYKNGALFYAGNITSGLSSGAIALDKGRYPFVAGDVLTGRIGYSIAANVCTQIYIEVEEAA